MISFVNDQFIYEPYPVSYITSFIDKPVYTELVDSWPDLSLFRPMQYLGNKYSLSEINNSANYHEFINRTPAWKAFHAYIKSDRFIEEVLQYLRDRNIDLGLHNRKITSRKSRLHTSIWSRIRRVTELSARFEFSVMDSNGGHILPHTDAPNKLITLVISALQPDEWNPEWGGGTEMCLPKDRSRIFNHVNKYMQFEEVDVIKHFPFVPNQCVLFIKTYNSWHQVSPIQAGPGKPMRRTITVNIENRT
jgi:hypothetical protein